LRVLLPAMQCQD